MNMELAKDIFAIVGAVIVLISLLGLVFFLGYVAITYTMVQNDKEIDYVNGLNDQDKNIVLQYKQARQVRFKDLFKKKAGKVNEDK